MAGGKGERLFPLTRDRAKPAVPFGGRYRIIDFVLSNMHNSGIRAIYVLTQYKAQSLVEHTQHTWGTRSTHADFVTIVPAQMRMGESWYRGTADAIHQNFHLVEDFRPDVVIVFGADHVYKMNVRQMVEFHLEKDALATIACLPVPISEASQFGIVETDVNGRVTGFQEKPTSNVVTIPGDPNHALASMGNYTFAPLPLHDALESDSQQDTHHDFGKNILPSLVKSNRVFCYDFSRNRIPGVTEKGELAYWRDVGTIEAYYEANMDLKNVQPHFNLYNWEWPIVSVNYPDPPSKLVFDDERRRGMLVQSIMFERLRDRRRLRQGLRARPQRVGRRGRRGPRFHPLRQRPRGQRRAHPARHRRQERARGPWRPHRARPGPRCRPPPRQPGRNHRGRQSP